MSRQQPAPTEAAAARNVYRCHQKEIDHKKFTEAESNMNDIVIERHPFRCATAHEGCEFDDEEGEYDVSP